MREDGTLPSYAQLFGQLDFREGEEARTVSSPAAYLVELFRLMEGAFGRVPVLDRRPDLGEIPLDAANTFTAVPYLDIVNRVLERLVEGKPPDEELLERRHPLALPFSAGHERVKNHLRHLGVDPVEFARLFTGAAGHDLIARLHLGLSEEDIGVITTPVTGANGVKALYGLGSRDPIANLQEPERFRRALGLGSAELGELLGLPGVRASVDATRTRLLWDGAEAALPVEWLDLVNRFVRLARRTGWTLTELCLALRTCNEARVDAAAVRVVAALAHLRAASGLGVGDLCVLVSPAALRTGAGEEHAALAGLGPWTGDLLGAHNKRYRHDLAHAAGLDESEIAEVVARYRARYGEAARSPAAPSSTVPSPAALSPFDRPEDTWPARALLLRGGRLAGTLGVSVSELFDLLDALDSDPALHRQAAFPVLSGPAPDAQDCHRILEGADPGGALWLVETLHALAAWTRETGFGGGELKAVLDGPPEEAAEREALLGTIAERFGRVALEPRVFAGERFGPRAAQVVHDVLAAYDDGVVSRHDSRLLKLDPATVRVAAYDAVHDLAVITKEDFTGLGLGERQAGKIFTNLVLIGHLAEGGLLAEPVEDRPVARDFTAHAEAVAALAEAGEGRLYPSDLAALTGLSEAERAEFYDNLLYNGVVDDEGTVLGPVEVNVDLGDVAAAVLGVLRERAARFAGEPLVAELGLYGGQDPIPSLRFNGYLDADGAYVDKAALARLRPADFTLALEFYPHRRAILDAAQGQIAAFKADLLTFTADDFGPVADEAAAQRVLDALAATLDEPPEPGDGLPLWALDAAGTAPADGLPGFTAAEAATAATRLEEIRAGQRPYRLDAEALAELGFDEDERDGLIGLLVERGDLDDGLAVPLERLDFFRNVAGALDFRLDGLEDYAKDVFFLLHTAATETSAAMAEIGVALARQAGRQRAALGDVLQDALGVSAATAEAICAAVAGGMDEALAVLVPPALDGAADTRFRLTHRRVRRFALLAAKLGLDPAEVAVAFHDQDLVGKFPEPLVLPPGTDRFDALLESADGHVYVFVGDHYLLYSAATLARADELTHPLSELSPRFAGLEAVDAAFALPGGEEWIVGHGSDGLARSFTRAPGGTRWAPREQQWGRVANAFDDPARIDSAHVDGAGRIHLVAGGQRVRYSGREHAFADEGFPRAAAPGIDAQFYGGDGRTYTFTADAWQVSTGEGEAVDGGPTARTWGRVRNAFDGATGLDAAYVDGGKVHLFRGDQVVRYTDSIENDGVHVDDGYPRRVEERFDAAFADASGTLHRFKDGMAVSGGREPVEAARVWGVLPEPLPRGMVDAAFVGLDGRTYLFSGERYIRYSGADYTTADLGYPRRVAGDWGGLDRVGAAFVLDGRTYLFGDGRYVRYSGRDYTVPDEGFPKPVSDNWWNLPEPMEVDAVFTGRDNLTYLFSGEWFVVHDNKRRWWSEPRVLGHHWDSLPFRRVQAAFAGMDGRTYVFGDDGRYVRYSGADYTKADDGYPAQVTSFWGNVDCTLARTGRVDATLVTQAVEQAGDVEIPRRYTYLFSGGQYVRYTDDRFDVVDHGYPRALSALPGEPRLAGLRVPLDGLDAAFADRRNVYLFRGDRCHVVSDSLYRRYDGVPVTCAFLEDGAIMAERDGAWRHLPSVEADTSGGDPARPRTLRTVPDAFRGGLDAVLTGADGTTYLFKGAACLNARLGKEYPLAEEWGHPHNRIYHDNTVDAAFVGRDGKTYLFSGDQFVSYTGAATVTDADPQPIAAHWGGLTSVALAYVRNGTTYLFEKPDPGGKTRYVAYSGASYAEPDPGHPVTADSGFWDVPAHYRPEGHPIPTAVLSQGQTTLLLYGEHCLQYDERAAHWSYPRPVERIWPGYDRDLEPGDALRTAFTAADGATYFFFQRHYTRYGEPPAPIRERWGRSRNPFVAEGGTIDAAAVIGRHTYLFSGPRYVRYTGPEYRYTDPGYPKQIAGNLRAEEPFAALPEAFDETERVDAVLANPRNVYVFAGGSCHVASRTASASDSLEQLGRVRNTLAARGRVDAALVSGGRTYLFSGDQYVRYTGTAFDHVDDGYPRTIAAWLPRDLPATRGLPQEFQDGIDAAFATADAVHLFKGGNCFDHGRLRPIAGTWGRVRNNFTGALDAAFATPAGEIHAFRAGQYVRYRPGALDQVEEGYPRTVQDDWGDLPGTFERGPDAAFTLHERTYLLKDDLFVRYSGPGFARIDRTFPQRIRHRWAEAADYRLSDLRTIAAFAKLSAARPGLAGFLDQGEADPYTFLCGLFGWDLDEVRWARRNTGLLHTPTAEESRFEIEFLLRLDTLFTVAGRMGTVPSRLHAEIWAPLRAGRPVTAAGALERLLAGRPDWATLSGTVRDELNVLRRDALLACVAAGRTPKELFERLLIDVEMGAAGRTSPVREAIAATQLFLHRYLLDLERVSLPEGREPETVRRRIRTWWAWMRNYRLWEANRKVFLHPENYLRPELRGGKTPAFRALEDELLQGEITEDGVQHAYKRYLDEYTEVSRLAIAGGYVYTADDALPGERRLVLFGRTRTAPMRYYCRAAEFRDRDRLSATWQPWQKVGVQIDVEKVFPVHAFGRIFVFWPVVETVSPPVTGTTTISEKPKDGKREVSAPPPTYRIRIRYSFSNLTEEWVAAQELPVEELQDQPISAVTLSVQASRTVPGQAVGEHDTIVVTCSYQVGGVSESSSFVLTPELYASRAAVEVAQPPRAAEPANIFDETVAAEGVVPFTMPVGSTDGPWMSVDHKGGSFLCRPITAVPGDEPELRPITSASGELPPWNRIDAAFVTSSGARYFFDNGAKRYTVLSADGEQGAEESTAGRWGIVDTNLVRTGVVDAVLVRGEQVYLFSGDEYYRYTGRTFGTLDPDYPLPLAGNAENLPQWRRVEAAFRGPGDVEHFLSQDGYARSGALDTLLAVPGRRSESPVKRFLRAVGGREDADDRVAFTFGGHEYVFDNAAGTYTDGEQTRRTRDLGRVATSIVTSGAVESAHVEGDHLYLTSQLQVVRYTLPAGGGVPDYIDAGYPKPIPSRVNAVFRRYAFSGALYGRRRPGQDLGTVRFTLSVAENWRSLPGPISGVLDAENLLYVFTGENYAAYPKGVPIPRPYEWAALPHEIVRLTSSTAYELNRRLLVGGVAALLHPETQEIDELPAFSAEAADPSTAIMIKVKGEVFPSGVPAGTHLDFQSANGLYYWEIFFHAPLLIAQALNGAQRFEEARRWYEYVFDPTEPGGHWRFVPFLAADVRALVDGCRTDLRELGAPTQAVAAELEAHLARLEPLHEAFLQHRELDGRELDFLASLSTVRPAVPEGTTPRTREAARRLRERIGMMARLGRQYALMGDRGALMKAYMDDPRDPHAIAELRPSAYRRWVVMAYVDNLLDWGDLLFAQHTAESIDEARMLYVFAHDLLGERDLGYGPRQPSPALPYARLPVAGDGTAPAELTAGGSLLEAAGEVHAGVAEPYFHVPGNAEFGAYWSRVEDRLRKIRQSLNIHGIAQPVPLFEPPADVMALVRGTAMNGAADGAGAGALTVPVPHHRFPVVFRKAQELADRLRQFGAELLGAFERRDAEELALLQNRQQGTILDLTRAIKEAEVGIAAEGLNELEAAKAAAKDRAAHYDRLLATGLTATQRAQLDSMAAAAAMHFVGSGLKIASALASGTPQALMGPFIMGVEFGGDQLGDALDQTAEISTTTAEGLSVVGELLGVRAEHESASEEWRLQLALARSDLTQLGHQIAAAELRLGTARRELEILEHDLAHQQAVAAFLTGKFAGAQLYQWMSGQLAGMYFQCYHLAHELARAAERAYEYETGRAGEPYIGPVYWESRRGGLMAGERLALDLDRLGKAHLEGSARELEITRQISLLDLDPLALLTLRDTGRCEFSLGEAMFDRDFPGHYRRRVRTIALAFDAAQPVNAVLTQLSGRTVLEPDPKAVAYLLDPKGAPPAALRADWRPGQQIALSHVEPGMENNGLFELRYDDDRYLPFEGCGAVSTWRLELSGRTPADLADVVVTLRYTARTGGEVFANAVKGMLRPYPAARFFDVAADFPAEWEDFLADDETRGLTLPLSPEMFPGMSGRQITGVYARYDLDGGAARFLVNGDPRFALEHGKPARTPGLGLGAPWALVVEGDKNALAGLGLVLTYRAL
ncbi:hemopexin repeat-containing protein [Nonomuraea sp. NPDC050790]|uniref:Tc toxin subunit A-related protein n=1 Tax=Nonomuraea sp. NPDC050790 TaxID=3364371 RepID=UPI00378F8D84